MHTIKKYFPELSEDQLNKMEKLGQLYKEWNQKINVVSRKDIDNIYSHHILHSLAIAKAMPLMPNAKILDLGTGGGLPGIPLAILYPKTTFKLIDGTRKKIKVVNAIIKALGLSNAKGFQLRAEETKEKFDFVICRAVASIDKLYEWSSPLISNRHLHSMPNGLITLKGGDIEAEMKLLPKFVYYDILEIQDYFPEPQFESKVMVYAQV